MNQLTEAMANVDRQDGVCGASDPIPLDRLQRPHIVAAQRAVEAAATRGVAEALAELQARADAQMVLARAMKRGGRDPVAVQPTDAQALGAIAAVLINVQQTREDDPEAALHTAFERGEAVARALAGDGQ